MLHHALDEALLSVAWEAGLMRRAGWLKMGLSVALGILILRHIPATALWQTFRNLQPPNLVAALGFVAAMLAVRSVKWRSLLGAGGVRDAQKYWARSLFGGFALGAVAPGRLGEAARCLFVPEPDRAHVLLLNIVDRAYDSWALLTCGVASLFFIAPRPVALFAVGVWLAVMPFVIGLPRLVAKLGSASWWPASFATKLRAASGALAAVPWARFAALALLSTGLDMLVFFFALRGFVRIDLAVAPAVFPWLVMAGGLPISVSGLGAREGAAALLLAPYGVSPAAAVDAALLLFALSALLPALLGGAGLILGTWRQPLPSLKSLETVTGRT